VFDGTSIYFVQNENAGSPGGLVARYDTGSDFKTNTSWHFLDLSNLTQGAKGFSGAAFDGHYLYAIPGQAGAPSILTRFDTHGSFTASWMTLDTTTLGAALSGFALSGFGGGAFDGRYVYLVPHNNGSPDGLVARLDTTALDFKSGSSWSTFDMMTSVDTNAKDFTGAIFDGRYLYFVPSKGGVVARFDARCPPQLPNLPYFQGSFL
jgi:hypothetical protein